MIQITQLKPQKTHILSTFSTSGIQTTSIVPITVTNLKLSLLLTESIQEVSLFLILKSFRLIEDTIRDLNTVYTGIWFI
jgi:hypothetical protein